MTAEWRGSTEDGIQVGVDKDKVWFRRNIKTGQVAFVAKDIRKTITGVHALSYIHLSTEWTTDRSCLKHSVFNIDRAGDRATFCRAAFRKFDNLSREAYNLDSLIDDFDNFCHDVWELSQGQKEAERRPGRIDNWQPDFLLKPYIVKPGGTIIFAPPGRGKSFLGLIMAICIDSAYQQLWDTAQGNVMFVNLERSLESIEKRIGQINIALGMRGERELLIFQARGQSLSDIEEQVARDVEKHKVDLLIVDSLSRMGYKNMIEDGPVNAAMNTLNRLCPSWLALGHTPRADEKHVFGSIMHDAAIDISVRLITGIDEDKLGLGLQVTKANDFRPPKEISVLALEFEEKGGISAIRKAEKHEFPDIEAAKDMTNVDQIKDFLLSVGDGTATEIAEELNLPRTTVASALRTFSTVFVRLPKNGKRQPYAVKSKGDAT